MMHVHDGVQVIHIHVHLVMACGLCWCGAGILLWTLVL